jgi:hypothetical protein
MQIEGRSSWRFEDSECFGSDLIASLCLAIMNIDNVSQGEADKLGSGTPEGITERQTDTMSNLHLSNRHSSPE